MSSSVAKITPDGRALAYSTYLGGIATEEAATLTVDSAGNAYVTGKTGSSRTFPITSGAYDQSLAWWDAYVTKFSPTGAVVYSTYLGGSGEEYGQAIAVDSLGSVYVMGNTTSTDFPDVNGKQPQIAGGQDVFVAKLNPSGSNRTYITYLGGASSEFGKSIAVDSSGNAYVSGSTYSTNFPTTSGAYDTSLNGSFSDAFITKLNPTGTAWGYSTFLGSSSADAANGIAVDSAGNAYVTGYALTSDFPVKDPVLPPGEIGTSSDNGFAAQINADGKSLRYSTFIGGNSGDTGNSIALDSSGNAYVVGYTFSGDFPTTPGAFKRVRSSSSAEAFVVKISNQPVVPRPAPRIVSGFNWSGRASVSDDDGLIMENVTLGARLMAKQISLPYMALTTSKFSRKRFELKPNSTGTGRSQLIGFWIESEGARMIIQATYRIDTLASGSTSYLFVTQRYEFHQQINEEEQPLLACEPSQNNIATSLFSNFVCARWKPIASYTFVGQNGETLKSLKMPQRLHFTPDGDPVRGNAVIRDCERKETGTNAEPCLFTSLSPLSPFEVYASPDSSPSTRVPGIKLKNNTATLGSEVIEDAIIGGKSKSWHSTDDLASLKNPQKGTWDNIHLTRNAFVDLPVPLPPGCPECVHIHWRWATFFGPGFGDGPPQIDGPSGRAGYVMISQKPLPSNQDVKIALVKFKTGEDDPSDAWTLANGEALASDVGTVLWYLATGYQLSDQFFAHGGFFSPLSGVDPTDLAISMSSDPPSPIKVGSELQYTISVTKNDTKTLSGVATVYDVLPANVDFITAYSEPTSSGSCNYFSRTVMCNIFGSSIGNAWITVKVRPKTTGTLINNAYIISPYKDTNFGDNRTTLTVKVVP